jgi:methyl-accepting chemotaxis protein
MKSGTSPAEAARSTATLIEEAVSRSKEGQQRLDEIVCAIATVTESTIGVKATVDRVAEGAAEQARGMAQIAGAMSRIEQTTQSAAAIAEESAAASEELSAQSEVLSEATGQLQMLLGGSRRRSR